MNTAPSSESTTFCIILTVPNTSDKTSLKSTTKEFFPKKYVGQLPFTWESFEVWVLSLKLFCLTL